MTIPMMDPASKSTPANFEEKIVITYMNFSHIFYIKSIFQ